MILKLTFMTDIYDRDLDQRETKDSRLVAGGVSLMLGGYILHTCHNTWARSAGFALAIMGAEQLGVVAQMEAELQMQRSAMLKESNRPTEEVAPLDYYL